MSDDFLGSVEHISKATTPAPALSGFHHVAYRCRDAEETRKFYGDLLGLKEAAALAFDKDPAGNDRPFMHLFFEMGNGSAGCPVVVTGIPSGNLLAMATSAQRAVSLPNMWHLGNMNWR